MVQKRVQLEELFPEEVHQTSWIDVGHVGDFPVDGGATIQRGKVQIAVFNLTSGGAWYASQNTCPHRKAFALSRGMIGDAAGTPKVACPMHKKTFSLQTGDVVRGSCVAGDGWCLTDMNLADATGIRDCSRESCHPKSAIHVAWTFMSESSPETVPPASGTCRAATFASAAFYVQTTDMNVHPTYEHTNAGT